MALDYRILGPLDVLRDGAQVNVSAPKERALLVSLLLAPGEAVPAGRLVDALWDEEPPASAAKLLQLYVSHLRRSLGRGAISTSPAGYLLDPVNDVLDSRSFAGLLSDARAARARGSERRAVALFAEALSLWRSTEVVDGAVPDRLRAAARQLEDQRLECLEERLALLVELGEHDRALPELIALCAEEPLRERPRAQLMLALFRAGRQAEALTVFRDASRVLREELGLQPGEELRALERAILRQDVSLSAPARAPARSSIRLPAPATELFGRERDRVELRSLLQRADVRLISLVGAGGTGKTRLALALAADSADLFPDGVFFVELAAVRDHAAVVPTLAQALEVAESPARPILDAVADAVEGHELLLVLDNFEHVVAAGPSLVRLLELAPTVTLLVTSRRVLHLSGEHVYPVEPLAEDAAVALFLARAQAHDAKTPIDPSDAEAVHAICRRLDGLPLAIELAAARVRLLKPHQILGRLGAALTLLTGGPRDLPARQQTLRDTLTWSVALLEPEERQTFAELSVFAGGSSLEAAERVVRADLSRLEALVDHSLLRRQASGDEWRFEMLETIREFASELLGERRPTLERMHALYFADLLEEAELSGPRQAGWLERLDRERANLRAALDHAAAEPDVELELRLVGALWRFWWLRGDLVEGRNRLEHALARAESASPRLVAQACRGAAGIAWNLGDAEHARELALRGLATAVESGEQVVALSCHTVLGLLARDELAFDRARDHFHQSAAIAGDLGREQDVTTAKLNLGSVAFASGDYMTARSLWEDVLAYNHANAVDEGVAIGQLNLGLVAYRLDQPDEARSRFTEARTLFDRLGFREHQAHALQGLAAVDALQGRAEDAARLLGQAARILEATASGETTFDVAIARDAEAAARSSLGDDGFAAAFAHD